MNKFYKKTLYLVSLFALLLVIIAVPFSSALASITPTLSLNNLNNGNIQITVYGDANSPVLLYSNSYNNYSNNNLGTTNYSGYLSTTIPYNQYNITSGSSIYVTVDGIVSPSVIWPYDNNYNNGTSPVTFSQNNITLSNLGQSTSVTLYGGTNNGYYISIGSTLVNASINNNILTLYGVQAGNATLTVCPNNSSACGSLYITILNSNPTYNYNNVYNPTYTPIYSPIYTPVYYNVSLSQNNLSLRAGRNKLITIYGGGNYYVYSNSNPYAVSASVNNNILYVYANNTGSSSIVVCPVNNYNTSCATLNVTVPYRQIFSMMTQPFFHNFYNSHPFNFINRYTRWW